ncbi:HAD family hydrolase [Pengzhenrongella frigida]|uniref:HAD family hydrolase n=2 Tax=Pengzhenrongella frigida TaxID=1259133 RepID=A0A4Q5N2G2_9MICO|nr:HAD family hydrolase [Cellulomonas sp. HLT2-17]
MAFGQALAGTTATFLPELPPDRHGEVLAHWRADRNGHYRSYTSGAVGYRAQRMARANDLHRAFGGPILDAAEFEEWDAVFESGFRAAWVAHDDAAGVVRELLAAGIPVGALSNASVARQRLKLDRVGLGDSVPMLVGVDTFGFGKPDPRVFVEACARLGTTPERTAYVGDELDIDAVAAADAGLVGVWLDRQVPGPSPSGSVDPATVARAVASGVVVVHGLDELRRVLGL